MAPAVLDSSPVVNNSGIPPPQPRRNLKRSASTASLLTPPRTVKRKGKRNVRPSRSNSRGSQRETEPEQSDSDGAISLGTGNGRRLEFGRKKRRVGEVDSRLDALLDSLSGEDSDNPFWDGPTKPAGPSDKGEVRKEEVRKKEVRKEEVRKEEVRKKEVRKEEVRKEEVRKEEVRKEEGAREETRERERSQSPPIVHFRGKAPVSPPPSRRQKTIVKGRPVRPLPRTPKGKKREETSPVRDSPNNPFLDDSPGSVVGEPVEPRTPTETSEKPTITYVFRGVRATFENPMYNLPPEVHERALLPVDHPDYSPDPACPPKLLFADAHKRRAPSSPTPVGRSKGAARPIPAIPSTHADDEWNDSDDDDELHVSPPKRLFY